MLIDPLTVDENRARVRSKQSENELEHDGLPGAARAEQDLHASLRDAEADVAKDDVLVEGERHLVEHDGRRYRFSVYHSVVMAQCLRPRHHVFDTITH